MLLDFNEIVAEKRVKGSTDNLHKHDRIWAPQKCEKLRLLIAEIHEIKSWNHLFGIRACILDRLRILTKPQKYRLTVQQDQSNRDEGESSYCSCSV